MDLVYIDSIHQYENVLEDIKIWLPKIKPNGMIGGHDYEYLPNVTKAVDKVFGKQNIETFKDTSWLVKLEKTENYKPDSKCTACFIEKGK